MNKLYLFEEIKNRLSKLWTTMFGIAATGSLAVATIPANNETMAVNGVTFTYKTSPTLDSHIQVGATIAAQAANIAAVLNASTDPLINIATYEAINANVNIVADTKGTAGNAFTLADSSALAVRRSASTLLGGTDAAPSGAALALKQDKLPPPVVSNAATVTPTDAQSGTPFVCSHNGATFDVSGCVAVGTWFPVTFSAAAGTIETGAGNTTLMNSWSGTGYDPATDQAPSVLQNMEVVIRRISATQWTSDIVVFP